MIYFRILDKFINTAHDTSSQKGKNTKQTKTHKEFKQLILCPSTEY